MEQTSPNEVVAAPGDEAAYWRYRDQDALAAPYSLPMQYLQGVRPEASMLPAAPLIVFINARSGGRDGPDLAVALSRAVGRVQVFDLSKHKPDSVLASLWANFDAQERAGDPHAKTLRERLRVLVAGGDGTIAWVLGCIKTLDLQPQPPVAIMPLGTGKPAGNDLSRSFGWGHAFLPRWIKGHLGVYYTLLRGVVAEGMFWNYLSVGLDAKAAHGFHSLRERKPYLALGRLTNQFWYSFFSCATGWFCCTKPLASRAALEVQTPDNPEWQEVPLGRDIRALVVLNLQSYAGGRNLWGPSSLSGDKTFKQPSYNDGLLEVVGLTSGLHSAAVMASKGQLLHARRLCQASGIRLQLRAKHVRSDGRPSHAYLQVDGEPWVQDVPSCRDPAPVIVEVSHCGVSQVMHNRQPLLGHLAADHLDHLDPSLKTAAPAPGLPSQPPQQPSPLQQQDSKGGRMRGAAGAELMTQQPQARPATYQALGTHPM
ncbi:diacylglycerol kinase [Haematococcus lacustris]|uniref:Diacylglycerol kinase n=2 Tax=Haematococcus lacustris TaxID=44745 RepID=A0A699ZH75_HAELA|nr:diacylglycerol kinase [Haematococcus lacustris]